MRGWRNSRRHHGVELWLQPGGPQTAAPLSPEQPAELQLGLPEFGVKVPFGPTDFTQVNHGINQVLVARALRLLDAAAARKASSISSAASATSRCRWRRGPPMCRASKAVRRWSSERGLAAQANALADRIVLRGRESLRMDGRRMG